MKNIADLYGAILPNNPITQNNQIIQDDQIAQNFQLLKSTQNDQTIQDRFSSALNNDFNTFSQSARLSLQVISANSNSV
ncbi:10484_t:CDS:2 [Gigaspora rosea]|nr:10484_t:CDS:2 [Gigaspora rosea]